MKITKILTVLIILALGFNACNNDDDDDANNLTPDPVITVNAEFTADQTAITAGESISFTSTNNENVTSWEWTFDNGSDTPITSSEENPTITFDNVGTYTVTLSVFGDEDAEDTEVKTDFITVSAPPLQSITFDGVDDNFTFGQLKGYGAEPLSLTVSAWIKTTSSDKFMQVLTSHEAVKFHNLSINSRNEARYSIRARTTITSTIFGHQILEVNSTTKINDGEWHHIVGVWNHDTHTLAIYVDGNLEDSQQGAESAYLQLLDQRTTIGSWKNDSEFFEGSISALSVWNKAFTSDEIADMETCYEGTESNLVAYWNFNTMNNNLVDQTGNGNDMSFARGEPVVSDDIPFTCE